MYKISDYVVYKRDVCIIKNIIDKSGIPYYQLEPIDDSSLKIEIPVEDKGSFIHPIMSKKKVKELIKRIPEIPIIDVNDKMMELEYKHLLSSGNKEDLIKIIKTTYQRNQYRLDNKKKLSEKDSTYFKKAERLLYNEFSIALGKSFEETKEYIYNEVTKLVK